ncbi:hypothetical protein DE146DRAFT_627034 [Phaeosphaeria sp. MPI-PUGE-AT-0046c]|nr:hypothetical protein DE146DRAFT_627034 [Phaeosphaeria sp. MPI-PUGE-AT-0046c]
MASNTPKTMSSRLMTMKFMQRSAHKATASTPSTPDGPPSKKARLSNGKSAPGAPGTSDHEILQSALAAEEKKRQEALDKAAQHAGETKWVLSYTDPFAGKRPESLQVRQAGYAEIDAADESDEDEEEVRPIRKQFGGGVRRKEVRIAGISTSHVTDFKQKPVTFEKAEGSEGEAESSPDDYDSDDPTAELIRETKREFADKNNRSRATQKSSGRSPAAVDEDRSLRGLESLSGGSKQNSMSNVECFRCGQKGHVQSDCPKPRGSAGRGRGRGRKP